MIARVACVVFGPVFDMTEKLTACTKFQPLEANLELKGESDDHRYPAYHFLFRPRFCGNFDLRLHLVPLSMNQHLQVQNPLFNTSPYNLMYSLRCLFICYHQKVKSWIVWSICTSAKTETRFRFIVNLKPVLDKSITPYNWPNTKANSFHVIIATTVDSALPIRLWNVD